ncbi:hypothetical protein [Streptomyces cavernicola]|uniref:Uncharacterized protein n=1 Tax=Streptomyces cavernicola TaxID=3043613 RepID=A0ABT6S742_9ACTN|nr:hypothetical protein [Streptomyces sp. B-S-A6]MDI3403136.1 hypothetical protein [Streptomyces sp. B-S-A6]
MQRRQLARLDKVRQAAESVAALAQNDDTEALRIAWLLVSLESAYAWLPETPEPPASVEHRDGELEQAAFRLDLAMVTAREAVAERLAHHLIDQAQPEEPELCAELDCPGGCTGRHRSSHIDCGPEAVFDDLVEHGIVVEPPEPEPLSPRFAALLEPHQAEEKRTPLPDLEEQVPVVLAHLGVDVSDTDVLLSAAVGLVADAWREGPLDFIHAAEGGPNDGEIFAQSVDLYRRAHRVLVSDRDDGPEALLPFTAVASDVDLPWAGGSRFKLRTATVSGSRGEGGPATEPEEDPVTEFVRPVDDRVWFTAEVMREQGWRAGLLHRAASAAFKASHHFGMPGWPAAVVAAMERLDRLDRTKAPEALADLATVEAALLEAPDRLGADALDRLARHGLFG